MYNSTCGVNFCQRIRYHCTLKHQNNVTSNINYGAVNSCRVTSPNECRKKTRNGKDYPLGRVPCGYVTYPQYQNKNNKETMSGNNILLDINQVIHRVIRGVANFDELRQTSTNFDKPRQVSSTSVLRGRDTWELCSHRVYATPVNSFIKVCMKNTDSGKYPINKYNLINASWVKCMM